jgi:hypothetical protein
MKMSSAPIFGAPGSLIFVAVAQILEKQTVYQPKLGLAYQKKAYEKKRKFLGDVF